MKKYLFLLLIIPMLSGCNTSTTNTETSAPEQEDSERVLSIGDEEVIELPSVVDDGEQ